MLTVGEDAAEVERRLSAGELAGLRHLCLCAMADAPDGRCVRRAYFAGQGGSDGLVEAVADLADALFQRAEAVSRQKMQWTRYGLRLPTRLRRIGDRWRLEGEEGAGAVSLRLDTFTSVMHQLGVLAIDGETWTAGRYADEATP